MKMNNQPKTARKYSLLQLAVFSVLQFRGIESGESLQNCKDCRLQMAFRLAEIKKTEL
ncbi:hypothetical protein [uncultured Alistipes sp.]|jgi:hypothetical protein|uniref:Uncharacterized protein n=1 Tax=Alistipes putredinis DSM 17216 TaxID=445970 RepID=B0MV50_9BACT|nr:hypothetical protein [uncultured Alistipes sp.]EDS03932.1 hypothetical protein ALIPUT_00993 [Alistipes putredinis DSM 17216]